MSEPTVSVLAYSGRDHVSPTGLLLLFSQLAFLPLLYIRPGKKCRPENNGWPPATTGTHFYGRLTPLTPLPHQEGAMVPSVCFGNSADFS